MPIFSPSVKYARKIAVLESLGHARFRGELARLQRLHRVGEDAGRFHLDPGRRAHRAYPLPHRLARFGVHVGPPLLRRHPLGRPFGMYLEAAMTQGEIEFGL